jgi:hypothetical protein
MSNETTTSFTIRQFCEAYHISKSSYYLLRRQGKTPRELHIGDRIVVITRESAADWEARMYAEQSEGGEMSNEKPLERATN